MFKKVTKIALAGIIGVGTMVGSSSLVLAAASEDYNSEANVQFKVNESITPPTYPGEDQDNPMVDVVPDPDTPALEEENNSEGTAGPLSIDHASHFYFGKFDITSDAQNHKAKPTVIELKNETTATVAPYVQITDNTGDNAGWTLQATQTPFMLGSENLKATMTFTKAGQVTSRNPLVGPNEIDGSTSDLVLNEGAQTVFSAKNETLGGTFLNSFGELGNNIDLDDVAVELAIPAGAKISEGVYRSAITWTLTNVPLP